MDLIFWLFKLGFDIVWAIARLIFLLLFGEGRSDESKRYGSQWRDKKFKAKIHGLTNGICACCHKNESVEIHHLWYRRDDRSLVKDSEQCPGDLIPLCKTCHGLSHRKENWIIDRHDTVLGNRNTREFRTYLQHRYQLLIKRRSGSFFGFR